ncbi:MAG: carbohydrate ABC transporter permease, partial [Caldilineaceae bacterium]|nr:carbohydrate ABC transporter permease [Caldilineaceae bacterium]
MTAAIDRIPNSVFRVISFAVITILFVMVLFPLYFMVTTSFKFESEIYSELTWIPRDPTLTNYRDAIVNFHIPLYLRNTLTVALTTTVIVVLISVLAAYSLTRLRFPGRAAMARGVLFVYLIPGSLMLIPMYLIIVKIGLKDSFSGLVVANMSFSVPFCTWLMMGYLRSISTEIEEASLIDGCTRMMSLRYIVIPLSVPAIITASIFIFNNVWNEY